MKKIIVTLLSMVAILTGCDGQNSQVQRLDVAQFEQKLNTESPILLDVRTPKEYTQGHLPDAINIDVSQADFLDRAASTLPQGSPVAVYCRSGKRSMQAASLLAKKGYPVSELATGINGWNAAGKPVTTEDVDLFITPKGTLVYIYCIKHGTVKMRLGDKWVYVDPVTDKCPPVTDYSPMPKANYILITHAHPDHLDLAAIKQLAIPSTQIIANPEGVKLLGSGRMMENGDSLTLDDFALRAVPAYNLSPDKQQFHPQGRDNGYVITFDGLRIYLAGDTEDIPELADIHNIDVAFLPCNLPFTMHPQQMVHAAKMLQPKVLFPYHYGQTDMQQVLDLASALHFDIRIRQYQ